MNIVTLPRRWTPLALGGCSLWLDGSRKSSIRTTYNGSTNVAVSSDPIGAIDDLSGVTGTLIQSSASLRPVWSTSTFPAGALTFVAGLDSLSGTVSASPTSGSGRTVFAVLKANTTSAIYAPFCNRLSTRFQSAYINNLYLAGNGADVSSNITTNTVVSSIFTNKCVVMWHWPGGIGVAPIVEANGSALNITGGTQQAESGTNGFSIGRNPASAAYGGSIAELVWFASPLSASGRATMLAYLRSKWGTP